ncbi:hypothetical protein C8R44DRAFT_851237 [Mycena epipterygia]|nr:hypothetical protein C8R44DRAFT_851237 [Mycena epipterygia]
MAPRTQRTAESDPTPPAPVGNLPRVTRRQALPPDLTPPNPVAPSHAAPGSQRNTVTAQGEPAPPARASGSSEEARGFAPLTSLGTNRGSGSRNQPGIRSAASQNPQPAPHTPARPTNALAQQTPGRAAANRLLSRLNQQSQMASPGPPVHVMNVPLMHYTQ